jgi:acetyltransferase-like isoleucine patch superfamily enzyme
MGLFSSIRIFTENMRNRLCYLNLRFNLASSIKKFPSSIKVEGKVEIYNKGGTISIGENCHFKSKLMSNKMGLNHGCTISLMKKEAMLIINDNCGFSGVSIGCFNSIIIGNGVNVGANSLITDSDWHENDYRSGRSKPVKIDNNVWIGYGVIILKGVTIGENSVIGAGSVVTRDIPANVIAAGNPCIVVKKLNVTMLNK